MSYFAKLRDFLIQLQRALKRARKPSWEELSKILQVCSLGLVLLGSIGLLIRIAATMLTGGTT